MKMRRRAVITAFVIAGVFILLGIIGIVTADQLGGFALIAAGLACLAIPGPILLIAFISWLVEYNAQQRAAGEK